MNKRSALLVASGLVLAMAAAAFGIVMGFTGPSSAGGRVSVPQHRKPIVKTVTTKKTVHVPAPGGSGGGSVTTVVTTAPSAGDNGGSGDGGGGAEHGDGSQQRSPEPSTEPEPSESPEPSDDHSESPSPGGDD